MNEKTPRVLLKRARHKIVLRRMPRQNRTYTQFMRFPNQYKVLVEDIIPSYLKAEGERSQPLGIVLFACSSGAEPFTLSFVLQEHFPDLDFTIRAFDIVDEVLEQARARTYPEADVRKSPFITNDDIEGMFDSADGQLRVKDEIARHVTFAAGDLLDRTFMAGLGKTDLVIAQNVLFHLPKDKAKDAFRNLVAAMKPGAALLVNGMDCDMRISLTRRYGLDPVESLIEEIHDDARVDRGSGWAGVYWGREPFSRNARHWQRRYGTVFTLADQGN